ncbi:MAG: biotin-dependent carboxyltransferase family protein, partial [Clostridia bacterium]|nr:biotin-dependent carboxyltransferase family protein [Clostridia bacterium]
AATEGFRCCLAVGGGFRVPLFMGSASTNLKISLGGYEGRKLRTYDKIETGTPSPGIKEGDCVPAEDYPAVIEVGAVPGPQDDMFTGEDIETFFCAEYTVTSELDRMGIRLDGPELQSKSGKDIISDGIVFGSVQIPNSGKPIILMADHQTTGGYAKIATVAGAELSKLAQARPGNTIRFVKMSVEEAEELAVKEKQYFEELLKR